jgi:hypothetical protein
MTRADKLELLETLANAANETPLRARKLIRKAMAAVAASLTLDDALALDRARRAAGLPPLPSVAEVVLNQAKGSDEVLAEAEGR